MGHKKSILPALVADIGILVFVTDSRCVMQAAMEAVNLCAKTVIPALFPMFFLCILLTGNIAVSDSSFWNKWLGNKARFVPFLICGFLGGYPTGAKSVAQAYASGRISRKDAANLLACCNQAGPAFIFGIIGTQFEVKAAPLALWGVQLLSAILLFCFLRPRDTVAPTSVSVTKVSAVDALNAAISAIARVCGWVILFRCLIGWCDRAFLLRLSPVLRTIMIGMLELTNGCLQLAGIANDGIRFILCSVLLTFGGLCVAFQTMAVTGSLPIQTYLKGKGVQTVLSLILSTCVAFLLFPGQLPDLLPILATISLIFITFYALKGKITVAFQAKKVYNSSDKA